MRYVGIALCIVMASMAYSTDKIRIVSLREKPVYAALYEYMPVIKRARRYSDVVKVPKLHVWQEKEGGFEGWETFTRAGSARIDISHLKKRGKLRQKTRPYIILFSRDENKLKESLSKNEIKDITSQYVMRKIDNFDSVVVVPKPKD